MARGRKSAAASAVTAVAPAVATSRLPVPADLSDAEADVWRRVTDCMPADWFDDAMGPLLASYCVHVVQARVVDELTRRFDPEWATDDDGLERLNKLHAMRERQTKLQMSVATKLRLTPQARTAPDKAGGRYAKGGVGNTRKPWQDA